LFFSIPRDFGDHGDHGDSFGFSILAITRFWQFWQSHTGFWPKSAIRLVEKHHSSR